MQPRLSASVRLIATSPAEGCLLHWRHVLLLLLIILLLIAVLLLLALVPSQSLPRLPRISHTSTITSMTVLRIRSRWWHVGRSCRQVRRRVVGRLWHVLIGRIRQQWRLLRWWRRSGRLHRWSVGRRVGRCPNGGQNGGQEGGNRLRRSGTGRRGIVGWRRTGRMMEREPRRLNGRRRRRERWSGGSWRRRRLVMRRR